MIRPRSAVLLACSYGLVGSLAAAHPEPERWPGRLQGVANHERPGEAVRQWMCERLAAFALVSGRDSLRVEREEAQPGGGTRVLVRQLWHGLPVLGADARAIVTADGRLAALVPNFARDLDPPAAPRLDAGRATAIATHASRRADPGSEQATLAIQRRADADHLVWEVVGAGDGGEPVRTVVDAVSGGVLEEDAGIAHAVGRVYPTDPRAPLADVELPRLLPGPGMSSPEFSIEDAAEPAAVAIAPGDYRFDPSSPSFDQVNLYWHVDHDLHDFLRPLGYAGPPEPLVVRLHFALEPEVARTGGRFVTFGQPIAGFSRETSRADDIVYHELGHAVLYGFGVQPGGARREASALHEGLADYFAAALTGDPVIGEWEYIVFPNGSTRLDRPSPPWDVAHYDQVAFGGGGLSSAWGNSMILSSGLWDLRQRIGTACDSLVLESLAYLPTVPTWAQFVNTLFFADQDHHAARFWRTVGEVLRQRGIHGVVAASIDGPAKLEPAAPADYVALPCCGGTPGRYHWRTRGWCRGMPCEPWRDLGDGDSVRTSFLTDSQLELSVLSPFGDADTAIAFVSVTHPSLTFDGPARIVQDATGTWNLRVLAVSPWALLLYRQWLIPGAAQELLGRSTSVTFAAVHPFRLTATLTDNRGRSVIVQLDVETFKDRPPKSSNALVRVTQRVDGTRHAEVHLELGEAAGVRMAVYDVRGRERARLVDEAFPRGERVIGWDTSVLEPGIYFLRAATSTDHSATLRFVVLH